VTPHVIAAAVPGPAHLELEGGCQDRVRHLTDDDIVAIAIADGLGSAPLGGEGAEAAVAAAIESIDDGDPSCDEAAKQARLALEKEAHERSVEIRDLACTLIVCIARDSAVEVGHVGDGGVVGRVDKELHLLSPPGESEYSNEVDHLASDDWADFLRVSSFEGEVTCLAAFSDGCQRAGLIKGPDGYEPFAGFFDPVFDWAKTALDPESASAELGDLLSGPKMTEHSEDDKTLAIAVLHPDAGV
jgi:hypothetical protein